jgi:glycosyltransferase involved in cell wall biosynthesis
MPRYIANTLEAYPKAAVVIPTRNRATLLAQCLHALAHNTMASEVEVIVIDDGSDVPLDHHVAPSRLNVTFVRLNGVGPAAARNAGIAQAHAPVVFFTDDDTLPSENWIEAALAYLDKHPACVGVSGPVRSRPWDPLTEHSIVTKAHGHHWTCNIAYRRDTLVALCGFRDSVFRFAHAEDWDLGLRALAYGQIGFEEHMNVIHTPRAMPLKAVYRQARLVRDDLILFALHPSATSSFKYPARIVLLWHCTTSWWHLALDGKHPLTLKRLGRTLAASVIGFSTATATILTTPPASTLRARFAGSSGALGCDHDQAQRSR